MLTTNDVRVLRLLDERGPLSVAEIGQELRYGLGAAPALRRLPGLRVRSCVVELDDVLDITGEGVRALRAADHIAYGRGS